MRGKPEIQTAMLLWKLQSSCSGISGGVTEQSRSGNDSVSRSGSGDDENGAELLVDGTTDSEKIESSGDKIEVE
nr:hypothetical protein Itr_chr12CG15910 [Ipomoea trifida]